MFGCSGNNDFSSPAATFRSQVNDPIGSFDHVKVMFDDEEGIARGPQFEEHFQQLGHVMEMQSGRRLIQNVKGPAGGLAAELGGRA